jgi:hemerythrin superfamily protein
MFDWFSKDENDAISILKTDHDTVKDLFEQFEKADAPASKRKITRQAVTELKVHAAIEEEIFYPAVRQQMDDKDLMNEADEEHHVAHVLIAELDGMDGTEDHYNAKFTVLAENVRHHIKEEEGEMFPKARSLDIDFLELGRQILNRKLQLKVIEGGRAMRKRSAKPSAKRSTRAPRKRKAA